MDGGSEAVGRSMNDQNHSRVTDRPSAYPDGTSVRRLAGGTRCRGMSGPDHCRVRLPAVLAPFQYSILLVGRQHAGLVHMWEVLSCVLSTQCRAARGPSSVGSLRQATSATLQHPAATYSACPAACPTPGKTQLA